MQLALHFCFNTSVIDYTVKHYEYTFHIFKIQFLKDFLSNEGHNTLVLTIAVRLMKDKKKWYIF